MVPGMAASRRPAGAAAERIAFFGRALGSLLSSLPARPWVLLLLALMTVLIVVPVGILILGTFLSEPPRAMQIDWSGLTLANYAHLVADPNFLRYFGVTIGLAAAGTIGATLIGGLLAWLTTRSDLPAPRLLGVLAIMPMFVPPLVGAFAWEILGSPRSGIINIFGRELGIPQLMNIYSHGGIAFVFAIYYAPYVYLFLCGALKNMDASLEEASALCGAGRLRTTFKITLPLVLPNLISAALLVFVLLVELFAIPAVLGQPRGIEVISVYIWQLVNYLPPRVNEASAHGVVLLLVTTILVTIQYRVLNKRSFVVVGGKGRKASKVELGVFRYPLAILVVLYALFAVVLPYAALLIVAFRKNLFFSSMARMLDFGQYSLEQFNFVLSDPVVALSLRNSITLSLATMAFGAVIYFFVAYAIQRSRLPEGKLLDAIAIVPVAIPGMILSLGYLWLWISLPIGIYGTIWILLLAYIAQFSPQGVRSISGSLQQIHPELEESSRLSGASFLYTLRRVTLPLVWPGLLSAMTLILVLSFRELATALFLYNSATQVFSVTMFEFWSKGSTAAVAVLALIQSIVLLLILSAGRIMGGDRHTSSTSSPT